MYEPQSVTLTSAVESLPDAVEADVARVQSGEGLQRLKNDIERRIVRRWTVGTQVLEAGIGTGRIGLALDLAAVRLTGLDRSRAMLDRCRMHAGNAPLELLEADLATLPFGDAIFDTVIAIDTLAHADDWCEQLDELLRVTRRGGRVIFDVGPRPQGPQGAPSVSLARSADEIVAFAHARSIRLAALVPYGALLGNLGPAAVFNRHSLYEAGRADRLLSWIGTDARLFAFATFLEEQIVARLTPGVAGRMIVVFERDDCTNPSALADEFRCLDAALLTGLADPADLSLRQTDGWPHLMHELAKHLADERNRVFLAALLRLARCTQLPRWLLAALPNDFVAQWVRYERSAQIEHAAAAFAQAWSACSGGALIFHGVNVGGALAASVAREVASPRYCGR